MMGRPAAIRCLQLLEAGDALFDSLLNCIASGLR
jgi:hypothetical protein